MSFSFFNSFNGNSQRLGQNYAIVSSDVNPPRAVSSIGSDTSSVTFSFSAPTTSGTIAGYTAYVNGKPYAGTGGPSSYTINGLSAGGNYTINMVANIVSTSSTSSTTTSSFIPTSVTGCSLWLDAADATTITQSSSLVSSWADKSGQGFHFTQNASKPTYGTTTDSKPSVNFNISSSQYLSNTTISTTTSYTILIVNKFIDYAGRNNSNRIFSSTFDPGLLMQVSYPPSKYYVGGMGNGSGGWGGLITAGDMISLNIIAQTHNGTNLYAYQNGTTYGPVSAISSATYTGLSIGGPIVGQFYNGNICEILMYNSVLSTTDRQKVEGYLAWKWSIQSSLPLAHPYYSAATPGSTSTVTTTTPKNVLSNPSQPLVISTLAPFPTNITLISATSTSITFSFTAPTTGSTPTGYTPYVNGSAGTGSGTPSSYTISGLSEGTAYSVALGAYITTTGSFNPTSLTGCSVWWDASDPYGNGTVPANGTAINTWTDKSGSGYNATATVAATYTTSNKALNFTTGFYTSNYPANPTNESCFIVFNKSSNATLVMIGSGVGGRQVAMKGFSIFAFVSAGVAWGLEIDGINSNGVTYLGEAFINSSNEYLSINGATNLSGPRNQTFTSGRLTNIGREGTSDLQFQGYIMEIIFYNSYLSTTDRQKVEGYLAWKWNIQANLPSAHPHYSAAPSGSITTVYQNPTPVSLTTI